MAIDISPSSIPGYAAAVRRENLARAAACLGLDETICGVTVKPLTGRHVRLLALTGSPFMLRGISHDKLCAKPDIDLDILGFLWVVSPKFKAGSIRRRNRFFKSIRFVFKMQIGLLVKEIQTYIEDAYLDAPEAADSLKSHYAFEISLAQSMHKTWGVSVDFWVNGWLRNFIRYISGRPNPIDIPLKIVWQLHKAEKKANDSQAILGNWSDKFISEHLSNLNREQKEAADKAKRLAEYLRELASQPPPSFPANEPKSHYWEYN